MITVRKFEEPDTERECIGEGWSLEEIAVSYSQVYICWKDDNGIEREGDVFLQVKKDADWILIHIVRLLSPDCFMSKKVSVDDMKKFLASCTN